MIAGLGIGIGWIGCFGGLVLRWVGVLLLLCILVWFTSLGCLLLAWVECLCVFWCGFCYMFVCLIIIVLTLVFIIITLVCTLLGCGFGMVWLRVVIVSWVCDSYSCCFCLVLRF